LSGAAAFASASTSLHFLLPHEIDFLVLCASRDLFLSTADVSKTFGQLQLLAGCIFFLELQLIVLWIEEYTGYFVSPCLLACLLALQMVCLHPVILLAAIT
jgi:hypothetical protein